VEQRTFQRVNVTVHGRFMREDRTEHSCDILDMSPGDISFRSLAICTRGERVIAYLDHLGRIEGRVTRNTHEGFAAEIVASERKREKLAAQLTWLVNRHELNLPEDRRHNRAANQAAAASIIELEDGRKYPCRIIDLSLSGAAVSIAIKPAMGTPVRLGVKQGRIVRHFEDGVAVEFLTLQTHESLKEAFGNNIAA
jgi:PilZ domain